MPAVANDFRLAELLGTLSLATDLTNGQPPEQCLRIAIVATRLAEADGADGSLREAVYWTAVLRYLGCIGYAIEEARFGAGDDIGLRRSFNRVDFGRPAQLIGAVLHDLGRGAPWPQRAAGVARFLTTPSAPRSHAHAQCDAAMLLARRLRVDDAVVQALAQTDERFDGLGLPHGLAGDALAPAMRYVETARVAVVFQDEAGPDVAIEQVKARAGGELDPRLAERFVRDAGALMRGLAASSVWDGFLAAEPGRRVVDDGDLDGVLEAFALYADLKSAYTTGHSTGVARLARAAARQQGLSDEAAGRVARAALLHDLGRVCVPTGMWDKPGPLNAAEWERVRLHAYFTGRVLRASPALRALAELADQAHERLDGDGYPRRAGAGALDRSARLLGAADTYHACTEPRAHRAALSPAAARSTLREAAAAGRLCREAVDAVIAAAEGAAPRRASVAPSHELSAREIDVIRLVARGQSNKEIARALGISPRTVQHHTVHIYDKLGVASRVGATLHAAQHGLLDAP